MPDTNLPPAGRYRFEEQIAAGGFGEVWRGTDITLGRTVAINIAAIHDFCEPAPPATPFLVMEYVTGPSLEALLADGPVSTASAMSLIAGAAAGLTAAHQAGLVHRDIKPANLLFTRDGQVKITDFGISHAAGSPGRYYWRAAVTTAAVTVILLGLHLAGGRNPARPYAAEAMPPVPAGPSIAAAQTIEVKTSSPRSGPAGPGHLAASRQ